jgi:hypothetical protein
MMNTDTATLPALAEAMTARDVMAWERHLSSMLGSKGAVSLVTSTSSAGCVHCWIRPHGYGIGQPEHTIWAPDWPSAIRAAQEWIANRPKVERNATIRKLALAIIELTDEHGKCTVAMLRAKSFDEDEIALHAEACVRAGEMAGNTPFSVEGV